MAYFDKRRKKFIVDLGGRKGRHAYRDEFNSLAEAEAAEAYFRRTGEQPPWANGTAVSSRSFAQVIDEAERAGGPRGIWNEGRDKNQTYRLRYLRDLLGDLPVEAIRTDELQRIVDDLRRRPTHRGAAYSNGTINRVLMAASACLKFAWQREWIAGCPRIPLLPESAGREETLEPEQQAAITGYMREHGRTAEAFMVDWLAESGMRLGEMYKLVPSEIGKDIVHIKSTKSKNKKPRRVTMPDWMCSHMRALKAQNALPSDDTFRDRFKQAVEHCGYSTELVPHSLRHTHATRLLRAGVPERVIIERLGWTSAEMLKRYGHVDEDMQREAVKKLTQNVGYGAQNPQIVPLHQPAKSVEIVGETPSGAQVEQA